MKVDIDQAIEQHFARIHRTAIVLTGNPWDADDLAQETFLVLARQAVAQDSPADFAGRSQLSTWLYGILLNLERRLRRRWGTQREKLRVIWNEQETPRTEPAAESALEVSEWKRSLWSFVSRLPEQQRQAVVLRYSEHLSYEQIATVLNCPLGTVKSRLFHGLENLRKLLEAEGADTRAIPRHPTQDQAHVS
ncbi:MAG: RNA polymerase sigma factor [Pirellulales bacterium]|nr:RNA polymerase sigma factor [Pirellulales bacterium]